MQTSNSPRAVRAEPGKQSRSHHPLRVVCFSTYVGDRSQQTKRHRDVRNFLLALRGERVEGESKVPVGQEERALASHNTNDSIDWFGEMATKYLANCGIRPPFGLVPVPTPKTTLASSAGPWTSLLAISIASHGLEDSVVDVLRWKEPLSRPKERSQTVSELYENLAVIGPVPSGSPIILVDYLFSRSSTLRACAAQLSSHGAEVLLGLCAGRTTSKASHDPFAVVTGQLDRYHPGH